MAQGDQHSTLRLEKSNSVATVILNRPEIHNAFNAHLVADLRNAFRGLAADDVTRVVVLTGAGESFCAGADLRWLQAAVEFTIEENVRDALALTEMLDAIASCPKPVVARVNGAALAGGAGLVAASDIAIAADSARFGFTEARLGLVPATISPYVVRRIGESQARALFLTAERFPAQRALAIGLVHQVVPPDQLDAAVARTVENLLRGGPLALSETKALIEGLRTVPADDLARLTAELIARLRVSREGQEGLRAFLEKRPPAWSPESLH
jgi:methylglutaconyl-CoA hydratase